MKFTDILRSIEMVDVPKNARPTHASALLLWYSKPSSDVRTVVELGSGSGIVSIGVAKLYNRKVVGVEIDENLVELAEKSAHLNNVEVDFIASDIEKVREIFKAESFDMVISNPPHHVGKVQSYDEIRRRSRSASIETVSVFCDAIFYLLRNRGEFVLVLSPESLMIWIDQLLKRNLQIKRMVFFHPKDKAELVALRGRKNAKPGLIVDPPILG